MSSKFQILDNRPIDKWKVVELKEELKKRRLTTRGLKKDLVKRLDAAVRTERENAADEADNGSNDDNSEPAVEKTTPTIPKTLKEVADPDGLKLKDDTADCAAASGHGVAKPQVENEAPKLVERDEKNDSISTEKTVLKDSIIDDNVKISLDVVKPETVEPYSSNGSGQGVAEERGMLVEDEPVIQTTVVKTVIPEVPLIGQHLQSSKLEENVNSDMLMECQDPMPQVENEGPKALLENEDDMHGSSALNNQVSEISPISGFQVKSDSVSTDPKSITEKIELKDNIVDDNVMSEMVEPYSSSGSGRGVVEEMDMLVADEPAIQATEVKTMIPEVPLIGQHLQSSKQEENVNSNVQIESQDRKLEAESDDPMAQLENEDHKDDVHERFEDAVDHGGSELEFKDAIGDCEVASGHGVVEETDMLVDDKPVLTKVLLVGEHLQSSKPEENANSNPQMECQDGNPQVVVEVPLTEEHLESSKQEEIVNSNKQMECQDEKSKVENEDDSIAQVENEDNKDDMHETVKDVVDHGGSELEFKDAISDCEAASGHGVVEESDMLVEDKPVVIEVPLVGEHLQSSKPEENVNSNTQIESQDGKPQVVTEVPPIEEHLESSKREENVNSNKQMECQDAKSQVENEDDFMDQLENEDHKDDMNEKVKDVVDQGGIEIEKGSELKFKDVISDCEAASGHGVVEESDILVEDKPVVIEVPLVGEHLQSSKPEENVNSNTQMECRDGNPQVVTEVPLIEEHLESSQREENVNSNKQMECQDAKSQVENEGLKVEVETEDPKAELESGDGMHDFSSLNNQVPEINLVSGFKVKSDSFSNDSMSINEKIELKDNINDENVKISQDVVKLEMVEPCSSTNVVPNNGESHPMDDDEQPLRNKASVDELDENNDTTADMSNKDDSEEMGYSEKLNLDRSSSDDSMEEDLPETKQIDSNCSTDEIEEDGVENEALIIEELESTVVAAGDGSSTERKDIFVEKKSHCSGKRKLQDEEAIENNRPPKRQKRNSDNLQVPEQQATQLAASQSNFSSSDSTDSEDTPKEQDVPPSQKPPTTSLRVDNFLRPFTLKAVQQLLGKTGIITSFWMDHIKTHCYVTYSSVEEAIETRNALYSLQWPPNGGRLLVAEFVDPHEVETLTSQHQPSAHQQVSPEKRLPVPPPSPPSDEPDSPMVTLDDLFWKTKATPKIYYLPLSEEQVAAKQTTRERNNKNW
ncbi:hypothetical protein HRI_000534100 [Hibiscus trionum]|uniref:SAP domain-containing protein n=1 Tax=Hibiscus trionum TaxID=183268 RepID=A0A9W7H1E2_HIBTR|nr:hypothetical protein HRI_000534100 [Hibiscus trionum]